LGSGLEWAVAEGDRLIHDNDTERLKHLLAEYPALLSWRADKKGRGVLGMATGAYGDAGDPQREEWFTRGACAELLIDAGAVVGPSVCESILQSRARGLLELFQRKGLLPRTLKFFAALGDLDAVRIALDPYERMQFLIDRGIDLTIKDYRWGSTAAGWARHAVRDEQMAQGLEDAERQRASLLPVQADMENQKPPRDSDPSEMTDFEKNATREELERVAPDPDPNRERQEQGNRGPNEEPGFGQGA
jgi:hypothetical protein